MKAGNLWALALAVALLPAPMAAGAQGGHGPTEGLPAAPQAAEQPDAPGQASGPLPAHPPYLPGDTNTQGQGGGVQGGGVTPRHGAPPNSAPPRSDGESSSDQTRIDLSPPKGDKLAHPDGGQADAPGGHEWNPMRAAKDIEVGDFYYHVGNYKAALSRFREALQYKPRDAVATFRLAQTLEKSRDFAAARVQYEAYLAILKDGPRAGAARKALKRLEKEPQ